MPKFFISHYPCRQLTYSIHYQRKGETMIETLTVGKLKWHHITDPTEEDFVELREKFHFHPLDIEDCRSVNQRPKIDIYDDYYFVILQYPDFDRQDKFIFPKEVKLFWGQDYIITLERKRWHVSQLFNEYSERDDESLVKELVTSDILLYRIIEKLMKESLYLLKKIGFELEMLNKELFGDKQVRIIERISVTRKNIITINTIFKPQLRMFHSFETGQIRGFGDVEFMEDYWGNILDYYQKVWDMTEDHEDLIEGLSKTFDSMQTNKTNEIMKMLTLLSSIILPLTFITGLFGMNVMFPFITSTKVAFWIIIGVMLVVSIALIYFFKHRKWWM